MKVEDAAALLGISRSCAYECVKRGQIPVVRLGRLIKVPTEKLEAMLAADPTLGGVIDG